MRALLAGLLLTAVHGLIRRNYIGSLNKGLHNRGVDYRAKAGDDALWFSGQKVDHFDNSNTATWSQKYYINTTFWQPGNPIFLILGGEGPISSAYVGDHFVSGTYAPIFGAMQIGLEHRYYGDSMPTPDSSNANIHLLSSEQALADAVYFANNFTGLYKTPLSKWIVFGGSYSGALSAWSRSKYPTMFTGSIASSGPVNAIEDFNMYFQVVATSLGPQCTSIIQNATNQIDSLLNTTSGKQQLQAQFNTCTPINKDADATTFVEDISDAICEVVQYNKDNNGRQQLTIDQLCAIFINGQADPVSAWAQAYVQIMGTDCIEVDYGQMINDLQDTSAGRCWTYQTCTEFGFYQTAEYPTQPFSYRINLSYFRQICQDLFSPIMQSPDTVWANLNYGSLNLKNVASNTFFGDGTIDPWHVLAILPYDGSKPAQQLLPLNSATVLINGTAHCADLYAPSPSDPQDLVSARQLELDLLHEWLDN